MRSEADQSVILNSIILANHVQPAPSVPNFGSPESPCLESGMSVTVIARAAAEPTFRNLRFIDIGGKISIFPILETPPTI